MGNTRQNANAKGKTRDINAAQRAAKALELRSQKISYEEIAARCGYASRGAAHIAVQREMDRVVVENVDELRKEELESLERLEEKCWERLNDEGYSKSMLFAVDRIIQIKERRARLMGLEIKQEELLAQQNYTKKIILTHPTEVQS
jgi:AraC-like DNA-binding protein